MTPGSYAWRDGREAMLRFGPDTGPVIVALLPLFEEANRTRAFAVTLLRALADRGIASILPDLPGQGESLVATADLSLADLRQAAADLGESLAPRRVFALAIRSGALADLYVPAIATWHFAPSDAAELHRDLMRLGQISSTNEFAGNAISPAFLTALAEAPASEPATRHRTVRLESDPRAADRKVPGTPLWRRAEPDNDPALAALLAQDVAEWIDACGV